MLAPPAQSKALDPNAPQAVLLSATPRDWEFRESAQVVEQIIRPTGLVDPEVIVRPTKGQIDDLVDELES